MGTVDIGEVGMAGPSNWSQDGKSECRLALNWDEGSRTYVWTIPYFIFL